MSVKRIERASNDVMNVVYDVMDRWHTELGKAEVGISVLMVHPPENAEGEPTGAPAIKLHGAACYAKIKRLSAEDRIMAIGAGVVVDARMEIDAFRWGQLSKKQRDALIDHELTHLYIREDTNGQVMLHDDGRPKLFMMPDDWQITGFERVTRRHGMDAIEFVTLRKVVEETLGELGGQLSFDFMDTPKVKAMKQDAKRATSGAPDLKAFDRAEEKDARSLRLPSQNFVDSVQRDTGLESVTLSSGDKSVTSRGGAKKKTTRKKTKKPVKKTKSTRATHRDRFVIGRASGIETLRELTGGKRTEFKKPSRRQAASSG